MSTSTRSVRQLRWAGTALCSMATWAAGLVAPCTANAEPLTYQGVLTTFGVPVVGPMDVRARLFDAETDGTQIGPTVTENVGTDFAGTFTVQLDFGDDAFRTGQARWLQLEISSPSGNDDFTLLNPRQPIDPTPMAASLAGVDLTPRAGPVVDQEQMSPSSVYVNPEVFRWQAFTAGMSGTLISLDLNAAPLGAPGSTGTLTVVVHDGPTISHPVIGRSTIEVPVVPPPAFAVPVAVPLAGIPIVAGKQYTFEFSGTSILQLASVAIPGTSSATANGFMFRTTVVRSDQLNVVATGSYYANEAATARTATRAQSADSAITATTAQHMPWLGLTGQAEVRTGGLSGGWQLIFTNTVQPGFLGGVRLGDTGFLELTNSASSALPSFARPSSTGVWTTVSDARLKHGVAPLSSGDQLQRVLALRPVSFAWNSTGQRDLGLIAQEVRGVMPELVVGDDRKEMLTVNYSQLSVAAVGAIQEIERQRQQERAELEARISDLTARLESLEAQLARIARNEEAPSKRD